MAAKLVITLDEDTTEKYLSLAHQFTEAHVNADCEPSGVRLIVEIGSIPFGSSVFWGDTELGDATVELS